MHAKLSAQFDEMFDEEREFYGDMPNELNLVMESYEWHYKKDPWKVLETEFQVETEFPDGTIYRGKVDAMIENQFGIWLVDHKTHKTLPDHTFRLLDAQSGLYLWAALRNKIPVKGFIWNYLRWKAPSVPKLAYADNPKRVRLSTAACDTDYPTFVAAIKKYRAEVEGFKITAEIKARADYLKSLRYEPDMLQASTFFRRDVYEKDPAMLRRIAIENFHTSMRMNDYNFDEVDAVERVVDRSCSYLCSYTDLCTAELTGANLAPLIKQNYKVGDPNDYYQDRAGEDPRKEGLV